jgi:hypothetical protein
MFGKRDMQAGFGGEIPEIRDTRGGMMNKQNKENETTLAVGASGSVGILPNGYFARILSDSGPEHPTTSQSGDSSSED